MQKMLLAATATACVMTLSPIMTQKVEAAVTLPGLAQAAPTSILPVGEYQREDREFWRFWVHRRHHRRNDYDRRYDGYRGDGDSDRQRYGDRKLFDDEAYRPRRTY